MLNRLLCFLLGHKRVWKEFTGEYGEQYYGLAQQEIKVPIVIERRYDICPRCGKGLQKEKVYG